MMRCGAALAAARRSRAGVQPRARQHDGNINTPLELAMLNETSHFGSTFTHKSR